MMTKYKPNRQYEENIIDRIYHSFSVDFWLVTTNLVLVTNWFLNPESLFSTLCMVGGVGLGGWAIVNSNRRHQQKFNEFLRHHKMSGLLTLILGLVVTVTVFNYATSPSHALILTSQGVSVLKGMFTGVNSGGSANTAISTMVGAVITLFRVLFFLGFMWALYKAYEKYTQQSELMDVIQTPLILLIVVAIVDGASTLFLKAG